MCWSTITVPAYADDAMAELAAIQTETLISRWKAVYTFRRRPREVGGDAFDVLVLLDDSMDPKAESRCIWGIATNSGGQHEINVQPVVVAETQYRTGSAPLYYNFQPNGIPHLQKAWSQGSTPTTEWTLWGRP